MPLTARPTVTVITPSLNHGRYLESTMCSVLDQDGAGLEYIVADGGSRDDSVELIEAYEHDLAAWRSGPDGGAAAAVNWALQRATGQWVVIVPAGDVLMPGALHAIADAAAKHPEADWLTGHALRFDERDRTTGHITAPAASLDLPRWLMHEVDGAATAATAYRRDLLTDHGPFDQTLHHAWHDEYAARLLAKKHVPTTITAELAGQRTEVYRLPDAEATLARGREQIAVAERYMNQLGPDQRPALWRSLDERRQAHAIAEAEAAGPAGQKLLWRRLMDRPWWINSDRYRRAITRAAATQQRAQDHAAPQRRAA